jgi:hypothetical protein
VIPLNDYLKMVEEAQKKRIDLNKKQVKKIKKMYSEIAKNLEKKLQHTNKGTLTERWLKDYQKQFKTEIMNLNKMLEQDIIETMGKGVDIAKGPQVDMFKLIDEKFSIDSSSHFSNMFTRIPKEVLEELTNGNFYKDGRGLNKRVWFNEQKANADFDYIIQRGIAEKKPIYDLAKDLAAYVNPDAQKDWAFKKLYPSVGNKKIEYNAIRLAITSTSHAYQLSMQRSCKANPYTQKITWHTSNSHRGACELCKSRNGIDFDADKMPLDHPMGVCYFTPVISKSLEDIGSELHDWLKGGKNDILDKHMKENYPNYKPPEKSKEVVKPKVEKTSRKKKEISLSDKLLDMRYCFDGPEWDDIFKSIEGSPKFIQDWYIKYQKDLQFDNVESTKKQGAYYKPGTRAITMNLKRDSENTRGKYSTFFHEFGHLLDHSCREEIKVDGRWTFSNYPSADPRFIKAIKEDYKDRIKMVDYENLKPERIINAELTIMLRNEGDLSSGVQDAYSGLTLNKVRPNWGHATDYWTRRDVDKEIASETFANMTSAYNNPEILKIMQKWFPKSCSSFEEIVKEIVARD